MKPQLLAALLAAAPVSAAELAVEPQAWFGVFSQVHLTGPWVAWGDLHARVSDDVSKVSVLVRPGVGYRFRPDMVAWLGYAWTPVMREGDVTLDEHRVWQQWTWDLELPRDAKLSLRSRLEQRLAHGEVGLRFRQFVRVQSAWLGGGPVLLAAWDEAFFAFNETGFGQQAGFDQNRFFAGVGLRVTRGVRLEAGYFNQYQLRRDAPDPFRHAAMVNIFASL